MEVNSQILVPDILLSAKIPFAHWIGSRMGLIDSLIEISNSNIVYV